MTPASDNLTTQTYHPTTPTQVGYPRGDWMTSAIKGQKTIWPLSVLGHATDVIIDNIIFEKASICLLASVSY